jgi:hypothetical protein
VRTLKPPKKIIEIDARSCAQNLIGAVWATGLEPVKLVQLLEYLMVDVCWPSVYCERLRTQKGFLDLAEERIYLRSDLSMWREAFLITHELGHIYLVRRGSKVRNEERFSQLFGCELMRSICDAQTWRQGEVLACVG